MGELAGIEAGIGNPERRGPSLILMQDGWPNFRARPTRRKTSSDRRMARRVLRGALTGRRRARCRPGLPQTSR